MNASANASGFTPEQDAQLLKMKEDNKMWKDIGRELGKTVKEMKARYRVINPNQGDEAHGGKPQNQSKGEKQEKKQQQGSKKGQKQHDGGTNKGKTAKGKRNNAPAAAAAAPLTSPAVPGPPASVVAASAKTNFFAVEEDELLTFGDILTLMEILDYDKQHLWERAASKFYDRTGRRVLPSDIRQRLRDYV